MTHLYVIYNPLNNEYLGSQWMTKQESSNFVLQHLELPDYKLTTWDDWTQISAMEGVRRAIAAAA